MKEKSSLRKRITAILASVLLMFSKSSADLSLGSAPENRPAISSELLLKESQNFKEVFNNYRDFKSIGQDIIPLEEILDTVVGEEHCDTMTPQGLASFENYLLVTAYDGIEGYKKELKLNSYRGDYREALKQEEGHNVHNSVIYVIDKNNKDVVTTIELPDINHVGGIAVDEKNAYIAKSSDEKISVISLDKIKDAITLSKDAGIKTVKIDYDKELDCKCDASFISIRKRDNGKNQLVVGTWRPLPSSSSIRIFDMQEDDTLTLNQQFKTNSSANGAMFVKRGEDEFFLVSCSIGKVLDSKLFVYDVQEDNGGKLDLNLRSRFLLPPMLEEIDEYIAEDGSRKLAIGSEIFSKRYEINRQPVYPNGIMIVDLDKVLDRKIKDVNKEFEAPMGDIDPEDVIKKEDDELEK